MINIVKNEVEGEVIEGDSYLGFCCEGFFWTVIHISPNISIIGGCCNPNCSEQDKSLGVMDYYRGIKHIVQSDLEDFLLDEYEQYLVNDM